MYYNLITNTDSYKTSHFLQYPPNTKQVFSYIEARGSDTGIGYTVFFGLQAFIKEYLTKPIILADVIEAEKICTAHGVPFNREGWEYIATELGGYLPLEIRALKEGTKTPLHIPLVTVVNTDYRCHWLTSYMETAILRAVWYGTTVATISNSIKQTFKRFHERTSTAPIESLDFKLHDFGFRGVSSYESGALGGAAHLVNFKGTDTMGALIACMEYYHDQMAGFSIPAAEHSTITAWGKNHEVDAYRNMLRRFAKPGSLVAVVSDSYDIYKSVSDLWGDVLKDEVIASGATVVVRPDSGIPALVVPQVIDILMERYGFTTNEKGYRVLPNCIRVIQGDGVNGDSIREILSAMADRKQSIDNIAFGMGGALLQSLNRDTFKFAMKCSAAYINDEWVGVFKQPVTDKVKASKKGILAVTKDDAGDYQTVTLSGPNGWSDRPNLLEVVYRDGKLLRDQTLAEIRALAGADA